jgi:two-component system, chemotaxis family, sensor kinase CheA
VDSAQYAELFLTESREHVSAINHSLLELERGAGGDEPVGAIFRSVHTIKGMSATMGYTAVATLSHELETLLDKVRRHVRTIDEPLMDLLFRSADVLENAIEAAVGGQGESVDVGPVVVLLREAADEPAAQEPPKKKRSKKAAAVPANGRKAAVAPIDGWTAAAPKGAGMLVRVRLAPDTALKGVRAFLVVQAAAALGEIVACSPTAEALQADQFDHDFALRLRTDRAAADVAAALRKAGDVIEVQAGDASMTTTSDAPARPPEPDAAMLTTGEFTIPAGTNGGASPTVRQQRSVRIDLRRLDNLMNLIGELVITRGRLTQLSTLIDDPALAETVTQTSRLVADLQDEIMTSRMVPVWQVFDRFPRLVRDAAHSVQKQVDFVIEGKDVELDRSMLDEVGDPIVHLLRNAVDHGIERPDVRRAKGKPPAGRLTLSALRDRSAVAIRVTDDGKGIDREKVLARALRDGLVEASKTDLSDEELLRIISRPGFSTAETVTDLSGRGVGIDAVYNRVRSLGGSVDMKTVPDQGTTVTLRLPLTLAIVRSLLARIGEETYAVPMTHVSETVELTPAIVRAVKNQEVLMLRDEVLPVLRMRALMGYDGEAPRGFEQVVVVEMAERRAALVVDALIGQQEIVVKQFDGVRDGLALFGGATILGDGAPALIIDVSSLL